MGYHGKIKRQIDRRRTADWALQVEMTAPGTVVSVSVNSREKKMLEAKYSIFRETIEMQKRWRRKMEDAVSEED